MCKREIRDFKWSLVFLHLQNKEDYERKESSSAWWGVMQGVSLSVQNRSWCEQVLKQLYAGVLKKMLEGEMAAHLGYEKNSVAGNNTDNFRNGSIQSEHREFVISILRSVWADSST